MDYSTDQRKGKRFPRAIHGRPVSCPQSTCASGSKHTGEGNQFMGVIKLPEGAIVEVELSIDKKSTNMQSKVLMEAELVEQINKYVYSNHGRGDFGSLVQSSDFV